MVSLYEQAQKYFDLHNKVKLSDPEQRQTSVFKLAMERNSIYSPADVYHLRDQLEKTGKEISALKENLEGCNKRYDVYSDIAKTYGEISKGDYISKLVEEKKQHREMVCKKGKRKL